MVPRPAQGARPRDGVTALSIPAAKILPISPIGDLVELTERHQILPALAETKGVISGPNGAAARLGVKRSTLQHKMRRLGIRLSRTASDDGGRTLSTRTVAK
jgi:transcriptional regulator with GAF, ATPase, and Fis domain